jgi:hypothetical protein
MPELVLQPAPGHDEKAAMPFDKIGKTIAGGHVTDISAFSARFPDRPTAGNAACREHFSAT